MQQPLVQEIAYQPPHELFQAFAERPWAILLDSALSLPELGRYSFIALDPFCTIQSKNGSVDIHHAGGGHEQITANPFHVLQTELEKYPFSSYRDLPPFQGGALGYWGYDLCHHIEQFAYKVLDDMQFPDLAIGLIIVTGKHFVTGKLGNGFPRLWHRNFGRRCAG